MVLLAVFSFPSNEFKTNEQSFSMYMPYAVVTMVRVDCDSHLSATISEHWAWTALYNASPVRLDMLTPSAKSVVDHMLDMLPPMSSVPWVDNDFFLEFDRISPMSANRLADADVSLDADWVDSPAVAVIICVTSVALLSMTDMFRE